MTFLPIVDRELRVAARWRRTYWTRVASAGVGLLIAGWMVLTSRLWAGVSMAGLYIFAPLNGLAYLYCLLAGVFKTADCLSEEKREGTLGLLFLTDLKGYDVVLGKVAATSLHWFYGLLAIFPMMAMAMLAGGVTAGEFWRALLALANTLFFSLAVGMLVSSFSTNERKAALGTVLLLFLLGAGPVLVGELETVKPGTERSPWFQVAWPGLAHEYARDARYPGSPKVFWISLMVSHLFGWLMLFLASLFLRTAWQEKAATVQGLRWAERRQRWRFGAGKIRAAFRRRLLTINPIYWLGSRELRKPLWVYGVLFLGVGYVVASMLWQPEDWEEPMVFLLTVFGLQAGLKIWMAFEACRRFVDDRRSGAMELMLVTPVDVPQILRGQWLSLLRQFAGPVVALLGFDLFLVWGGLHATRTSGFELEMLLAMFAATMIAFLVDMWTLGWLGMRLGMALRHAYLAGGLAIAMILMAPWVIFYVGVTGVAMAVFALSTAGKTNIVSGFTAELTAGLAAAGWLLLSLAIALSLGLWARHSLRRHFRALAAKERKFLIPKAKVKTAPPALPPPLRLESEKLS